MITDTAGIRDTPSDEIEAIGIKKALRNWARPEIPYQYQQYTGRE